MVNAFPSQLVKRQTSFGNCPGFENGPAITDVTLNPDPPKANSQVEVKGSANTNNDIVSGTFFGFEILNDTHKIFSNARGICDQVNCQIKVFDFDEKYDLEYLPSSYQVAVFIGPDPNNILACGMAQ
ncbi:5272_t:CDS:1, partial [Racocetra fulgida]